MANGIAAEATIERPIEEVWAALTDWEHTHQWMRGVDSMSANGDTALGTTLTFHARGKDRTSEIVALDPGRSLTMRSVQAGVTADYAYGLRETSPRSTAITLNAACHGKGLTWTVAGPLIRFAMRRVDGGQLEALKSYVEGA